jgi:hypothetical protein
MLTGSPVGGISGVYCPGEQQCVQLQRESHDGLAKGVGSLTSGREACDGVDHLVGVRQRRRGRQNCGHRLEHRPRVAREHTVLRIVLGQ